MTFVSGKYELEQKLYLKLFMISVMGTEKWNLLKQNYSNIFKNKYVVELLIFFLFSFCVA